MVAPAKFLNIYATLGTRLRSNRFDCLHGLPVLLFPSLVAVTRPMRLPRTITRQANLVLAVWAFDLLLLVLFIVSLAVINREVLATFLRETGNIGFAGGKSVRSEGFIEPITFCQ